MIIFFFHMGHNLNWILAQEFIVIWEKASLIVTIKINLKWVNTNTTQGNGKVGWSLEGTPRETSLGACLLLHSFLLRLLLSAVINWMMDVDFMSDPKQLLRCFRQTKLVSYEEGIRYKWLSERSSWSSALGVHLKRNICFLVTSVRVKDT